MKYIKVTEVDNTGQQIYCRKCAKPHAILKYDGQVLQIGNVQFFNNVRYSCICGFPQTFFASPIKDEKKSLGKSSRTILIDLGKDKKIREDK
jgi:hypothetical protein